MPQRIRLADQVKFGHTPTFEQYEAEKEEATFEESLDFCLKYFLFFSNFFLWIFGTILLGIGIVSWFLQEDSGQSSTTSNFIFSLLLNLSVMASIIGVFLFILSFTGCMGALRENVSLLKTNIAMLLVVFFVNVLLLIAFSISSGTILAKVEQVFGTDGMRRYQQGDSDWDSFVNGIQERFQCCGASVGGYTDWQNNEYFRCEEGSVSRLKCFVPFSCCKNQTSFDETGIINVFCGANVLNASRAEAIRRIYVKGCVESVADLVRENIVLFAVITCGVIVFQIIGLWLSLKYTLDLDEIIFNYRQSHPKEAKEMDKRWI